MRCTLAAWLGKTCLSAWLVFSFGLSCYGDSSHDNLASVAVPSSSYTSGDTSLDAMRDGFAPRSSGDWRHGSYGNWNRTGTQWVEYTWDRPIVTDGIEVYWWADGRGINLPEASRLLYWDGDQYQAVPGVDQVGVERDQFNRFSFEALKTTRLRLEIDSNGRFSTGILEWRVWDNGQSPAFPPQLTLGPDRIVMLGGKTYLNATLQGVGKAGEAPLQWSKQSGPGAATFADATSTNTTATFDTPGEYVLQATAGEGDLQVTETLNVRVETLPPETPLGVVYTKRYQIDSPLWNHRAKALITKWIPHCVEEINRPDLKEGGINNFVEAAKKLRGEPSQPHRGYVFSNAWVHQTVESICIALMVDPQGDQEIIAAQAMLRDTLEDWIPKILAAQEPDGYLQTTFTLNDRMNRWQPESRSGHEGYVAGYFIESAINHYTLTNGTDLRLYNAAKKLADCWVAHIGPEPGKIVWYDEHQEMEQALVRFGRFVNDMEGGGAGDSYIRLAKFLIDSRAGGNEYDQSHLPVQQQYEAVGHAVRAVYLYSGMADVATETGDLDYRSAVMSLWDNLINKKYYVTGGVGSGETSEGFGPNYSLPQHAYCESCSSCGNIFFQYKMHLSYHEAKYVDLYEETFYNALLGSLSLDGGTFYYDNPLVERKPRYPWHGCPCCVGNIPRTLLMLPTWTYTTSSDGIYVNLFIGGTTQLAGVAGTDVELVQQTDYPWNGKVQITVNPAESKEFALRIRSPERSVSELYTSTPAADGMEQVLLNGKPVEQRTENGYVVIDREWQAGDTVSFELPMTVQRVTCDPRVEANRGRVALRYGPLVYSIESVDGNDLNGVLANDAPLATQWRPDLLGGVVVIKGKFADGSPLLAIPNFARNNRGGGSEVWIRSE
ncbi:glycoside hydrolase family 127 protein [Aeoliella mucimassa]|uniref:Non-reducing end beta-L-arabinofuranosidase n=1 Tax=Aeoliella mucimassa TaxID=2527972 RepID=A0A518ALX5_9BACT|nr:beta-L-arabinofuranosidase domain-containing protein [Aeoliella mucimassa]QDU55721.1 Non-reducing end beta-L-arabinofuranosidase [Aeoliella mucimassa]